MPIRIIPVFILALYFITQAKAQTKFTDSIDNVLKSMKEDTAKVRMLFKAGKACLYSVPNKANDYYEHAMIISKKNDYPYGLAWSYLGKGSCCFYDKKNIEEGLNYYKSADSIFRKYDGRKFKEGLGALLCNYGSFQQELGNYPLAIQSYIKASSLLDSLNNKPFLCRTYSNLSTLYAYVEQYDEAEFYSRQVVKIAEERNDLYYISMGNINLASILISKENYKEAYACITKAKKIAEEIKDQPILSLCYSTLGEYNGLYKNDYDEAIHCMKKSIEISKLIGNNYEESKSLVSISEFYLSNKHFNDSKSSASQSLELSNRFNLNDLKQRSLHAMAKTEAHFGEYQKAYDHLLKSAELKDSIYKDKSRRQINYLETLYQSERKEKEIDKLQSEKQINRLTIKRRTIVIYSLAVIIVLVFGIAFLLYYTIRNKHIIVEKDLAIQRQKVIDLEKDRKLVATHALLEGETSERSRISRDLHDGLGGMLSVVKLKFSNVKGNMAIPSDLLPVFNGAIAMLDSSITELRRVAHNLMPESLMKFGLNMALMDFCDSIENASYQCYGNEKRLHQPLEIAIYRIIHELVNNAIKYAEASKINVQLIFESNRIGVVVHDDGKGFDLKLLNHYKGNGIRNIQSRVATFGGLIDFSSSPGLGTEVTIEFKC